MGDHRLPKTITSGELENAGQCGPGGKENEWTDCMAEDRRVLDITGDWYTSALWALVQHIMRRGFQVYGRVGEK